jgi:hypothetical protein
VRGEAEQAVGWPTGCDFSQGYLFSLPLLATAMRLTDHLPGCATAQPNVACVELAAIHAPVDGRRRA